MIGVATQPRAWSPVDADLDTLATALYVTIDELLQHALGWPRGARPWGSRPRSATPNWSPWRSSKPCSASPPKPAGWARPTASCATCSRSCPANLAITSACAAPPSCCATPSAPSPPTPPCRPTRSGSSTPPRWSAAARGKPPSAPSLQGGRRTAGAPAIRAGLGPATAPGLHPAGLPVLFALTGAKAADREVLLDLLTVAPQMVAARPGQLCWPTSTTTAASSRTSWPDWGAAAATGPQGRGRAGWRTTVSAAAAADRVGQRHLQGPARP